ncbi:hypothetical protein D9M70_523610 [compost metagenome]
MDETVEAGGALAKSVPQQSPTEQPGIEKGDQATQKCCQGAEQGAGDQTEGITGEKSDDLARKADCGKQRPHGEKQQGAFEAVATDVGIYPGLVDGVAEVAAVEQVTNQRQAEDQSKPFDGYARG